MPFLDGVKGPAYYREWRAQDAVAGIVFLHGFGEHSGLYHRLAAALDQRGVSLWAIDEIGHGLTGGERGHVESLDLLEENGRRLTAVATGAQPGLPLLLAGHSLGGVTAALAAARDPEPWAGVVLSGTPVSPIELPEGSLGPDGAIDLTPEDLSQEPAYLDALANDPLAFTDSDASPLDALPPAWEELAERFAALAIPVLFVHGEQDPLVRVEGNREWADRLEFGRIATFPGARHDVLNETVHREVAATIADFAIAVASEAPEVALRPA